MAIKNLIARGIGFGPGSVAFIPTHGFTPGAAATVTPTEGLEFSTPVARAHYHTHAADGRLHYDPATNLIHYHPRLEP